MAQGGVAFGLPQPTSNQSVSVSLGLGWLGAWQTSFKGLLHVLLGLVHDMLGRLHASLQRRTVCPHDAGDFPTLTKQFWYEHASATIWWDLDLLYQAERDKCSRLQKRCHWMTEFSIRAAINMDIAMPLFQEWEARREFVPCHVDEIHNSRNNPKQVIV